MTIVVRSSREDAIALPAWLMTLLNLREGEAVKTIVDGQTLRLARLDRFLALRGMLADDEAFDRAIELLDRAWQTWTMPLSA